MLPPRLRYRPCASSLNAFQTSSALNVSVPFM